MIINHYLADKNTTEIFKISGSYKFDSWIKYQYLEFQVSLKENIVFPEDVDIIKGKAECNINDSIYEFNFAILKTDFSLVDFRNLPNLIMQCVVYSEENIIGSLLNETFNGRKLGDFNNDNSIDFFDAMSIMRYNAGLNSGDLEYMKFFESVVLSDTVKYNVFLKNTSSLFIKEIKVLDDYSNVTYNKIGNDYIKLKTDATTNFQNYLHLFNYKSFLDTRMYHTTGIETSLDYVFEEATIGKYYKVQYTVIGSQLNKYGVYVMVGNNKGTMVQSAGTYTEYLKMTETNKVSIFASGNVTVSNFSIEEYVVIADPLDFNDKDAFINYSWTLSYSLDFNNWISYHSYIPDLYLTTNNYLYSLVNDDLSIEYTIRDEDNNYITGAENEIIIYNTYTYD